MAHDLRSNLDQLLANSANVALWRGAVVSDVTVQRPLRGQETDIAVLVVSWSGPLIRDPVTECVSPFYVPLPSVTYHLDDKPVNGKQSDCGTEDNEEENPIKVQGAQNIGDRVIYVAS